MAFTLFFNQVPIEVGREKKFGFTLYNRKKMFKVYI